MMKLMKDYEQRFGGEMMLNVYDSYADIPAIWVQISQVVVGLRAFCIKPCWCLQMIGLPNSPSLGRLKVRWGAQ